MKDRYLWNALKYLARCGKKDDPSKEVGKAIWYLVRWLASNSDAPHEDFESIVAAVDQLVQRCPEAEASRIEDLKTKLRTGWGHSEPVS